MPLEEGGCKDRAIKEKKLFKTSLLSQLFFPFFISRYKLFAWTVDPDLDYKLLMDLAPSELGVVAVLYKLQHYGEHKVLQGI